MARKRKAGGLWGGVVSVGTRRRQKVARATPRWLTPEHHRAIHDIYCRAKFLNRAWRERQGGTSRYRNYYSVDHIIPLDGERVCGLHVPWNLRIMEKAEDNRMGNKARQGEPEHGLPPWEKPKMRVLETLEDAVRFARE